MYALKKLLLIMSLLFSSSISLFFESCLLCSFLRWTLFLLILLPARFEKTSIALEVVGLLFSIFLSFLQNPLFCESGCNTLLSILPLTSLGVFFLLLLLRIGREKKQNPTLLENSLPPLESKKFKDN